MSNFDKVTDLFGKATEGIEKWLKATTSAQNSRILGAALSDAGMGAAVGAVGGLFTDQGITEGALSGAILGAGAGALMKRSQILESKASTKNVDRMRRQRDRLSNMAEKLESNAAVAAEKAGRRDAALSKIPLSSRIFGSDKLTESGLNSSLAKGLDKQWKKESKIASSKVNRINEMRNSLTKSIDAERAAISQTLSTSATGAGAVGGLASLAFATLDSNRV
jgi:hypothetical protein